MPPAGGAAAAGDKSDEPQATDDFATGAIFQQILKATVGGSLPTDLSQLTCYQFCLVLGYTGRVKGMSKAEFRERLSAYTRELTGA